MMNICSHGVEISPSKEDVIAGGVQNNVIRSSKYLYEYYGIFNHILTDDRKYREIGEESRDDLFDYIKFHYIKFRGNYSTFLYSVNYDLKITYESLKLDEIEVFHGHSGLLNLSLVTKQIGLFNNLPTVHSVYCPVRPSLQNKYFYSLFASSIDKIIAISNNVKESLVKNGISSEKITVIPPLIDFSEFKPGISKSFDPDVEFDEEDPLLMYLGNLKKTKQIDVVLDALYLVKKKYPKVKLISGLEYSHTATTDRQKNINNKIKRYDLEDNIVHLGITPFVAEYMDLCDIVVAPFNHTFEVADYPLTVLESMGVGTPVITTPVGGISEVVEDEKNGILVPPNDPKSLAKKIIYLLKNDDVRIGIGKNSNKYMRKNFSPQRITKKIKEVYEEVV